MTKHHKNKNNLHNIHQQQARQPHGDSGRSPSTSSNRCHCNNGTDSSDLESDCDANDGSSGNDENILSKCVDLCVSVNECSKSTSAINESTSNESTRLFDTHSNEELLGGEVTNGETRVCYSAVKDYLSLNESLTRSCNSRSRTASSNASASDGPEAEVKGFSLRNISRDQWIILLSTCSTSLVSFLCLSILAPFFPLEADKKNVNSTISGWIFGVFAFVQFVASPFFGRLMPKVGSRFMYIAGVFICGGCSLLFGLLDRVDTSEDITLFVSLCVLTRVLLALGSTAVNNAGFVFIIKYFPDHIATVFGISEVFTGVGMVTGPALGGFLYSAGGFILPFAVVGGSCFLALPFVWWFLPHQDDSATEDESGISLREVILHPRSIVNSIVVIVATTVWSVLDPTLEPHLRVYGLGPELVGMLFLIMAAFYSVASPIWGRVADHLSDNRVLLIPGLLISAVGLLLVGPSPALGFELSYNKLWLTIISLVILGVGCSMASIPSFDVYIDVLEDLGYPESTRTFGMVSSLWMSMYALGDFTGPIMGGFLFDEIGFEWLVSWIAAACVLTACLVAVTWYCEKRCCKERSDDIDDEEKVVEGTPLLAGLDMLSTFPPGFQSSYSSYVSLR